MELGQKHEKIRVPPPLSHSTRANKEELETKAETGGWKRSTVALYW